METPDAAGRSTPAPWRRGAEQGWRRAEHWFGRPFTRFMRWTLCRPREDSPAICIETRPFVKLFAVTAGRSGVYIQRAVRHHVGTMYNIGHRGAALEQTEQCNCTYNTYLHRQHGRRKRGGQGDASPSDKFRRGHPLQIRKWSGPNPVTFPIFRVFWV